MSVFELEGSSFYPATDSGYMGVVMFKRDGVLYHYRSHDVGTFNFSESGVSVNNLPLYSYDGSDWVLVGYSYDNFTYDDILVQTYRSEYPKFYALEDVRDGNVAYSYTSHAFGSMQTASVLGEVVSMLPVLLIALVFYVGVRKAVSFMTGTVRKG